MIESNPDLLNERYRNYLVSLARIQLARAGPVRNKLEHSDLVQEVLIQAHTAREQFRGTTDEEYAAWLRQILANKLADAQRYFGRGKRDAALEATFRESLDGSAASMLVLPIKRPSTPTYNVVKQEQALRLADALQTLPEDQRTAVEMRYVGEYSLIEIAKHMQRTKASVAGLLRRGLQALREELASMSA